MSFICPICIDDLSEDKNLSSIKCGHVFHEDCLKKWMKTSKSCPQCRKSCKSRNMAKLFLTPSEKDADKKEMATEFKLTSDKLIVKERELAVSNYVIRKLLIERANNENIMRNLNEKIKGLDRGRIAKDKMVSVLISKAEKAEKEKNNLKIELDKCKNKINDFNNGNLCVQVDIHHQKEAHMEQENKKIMNETGKKVKEAVEYAQEVLDLKIKPESFGFGNTLRRKMKVKWSFRKFSKSNKKYNKLD